MALIPTSFNDHQYSKFQRSLVNWLSKRRRPILKSKVIIIGPWRIYSGHHLVNKHSTSFYESNKEVLSKICRISIWYQLTKITGILLTGISFEFISLIRLFLSSLLSIIINWYIPEVVASFGYITTFSELPIQKSLRSANVRSVKPIKAFKLSLNIHLQFRAPQHSLKRSYWKIFLNNLGINWKISFTHHSQRR